MAKILFINPVVREEDHPKHVPYGMALLASIALKEGHLVQVYDDNAWRKGKDVLAEVIGADDWDVIATGGLTTTYANVKNICRLSKAIKPNALLIVGGGIITSMPHDIMEWVPEIDIGIVGEAFVTFPELLKVIDCDNTEDGLFVDEFLGICYRDSSGRSVLNGARPNIADLDVLPYPAWELFPLDIYFSNSRLLYSEESFISKRRIDINGSLGCNLVCRFCWHLGTTGDMVIEKDQAGNNDVKFSYGRNLRFHSPDYLVGMANYLVDKYDIDFVSFLDENFFTMDVYSKRTWLKELSAKWISAGLQPTCRRDGVPHDENCTGVHWSGTSHATLHRQETLVAMYEAGCSHLVYGLETFDPGILKNLGKGSNVKNNKESVKLCLSTGIKPIPNIMIGFPEETFETVRNTINALIELGIHASPHFATPYPGSEWYYTYKESIMAQYDGNLERFIEHLGDASSISAVISHKFSGLELLGLQQIVLARDLRLLQQAEDHWGDADSVTSTVAIPRASHNFVRRKIPAPLEVKVA